MKDLIRQLTFARRIEEVYQLERNSAVLTAERMIREIPEILLPNIDQWSEGEKLTDIYIGEYSIPMIMAIWKNDDFLGAASVMSLLKRDPDQAVRQIWNMKR